MDIGMQLFSAATPSTENIKNIASDEFITSVSDTSVKLI